MAMNLFPQERAKERTSVPEIQNKCHDEREDPLFLPPVRTEGRETSRDKEDKVAIKTNEDLDKWPLIMEEFCTQRMEEGRRYF